jgi:hypothetical protein
VRLRYDAGAGIWSPVDWRVKMCKLRGFGALYRLLCPLLLCLLESRSRDSTSPCVLLILLAAKRQKALYESRLRILPSTSHHPQVFLAYSPS